MPKGFSSPAQFRGDDMKSALIKNWRNLTTFLNSWVPTFEPDGETLVLPGVVSGVTPTAAAHLATKGYVDGLKASQPWGVLGRAEKLVDQGGVTAEVALTGLTTTFTGTAGRLVKVSWTTMWYSDTAGAMLVLRLKESGVALTSNYFRVVNAGGYDVVSAFVYLTPAAGSHTYYLTAETSAGSWTCTANAVYRNQILVEDIGLA